MANGLFNLKQVIQAVQQGGWPNQRTPSVEYLVVAGGGAGGQNGGGGGAGGLLTGIDPVPNDQTLLVTVGAGGASQTYGNRGSITGGQNSVFGNITATGGGQGGTESYSWGNGAGAGASGGSGGGGGFGPSFAGGSGVSGQGNTGGSSFSSSSDSGGGGGGAGTIGLNAASSSISGNGGAGIASAINGTVTTYAGGGGAGNNGATQYGSGGVGGGGRGGGSTIGNAVAGTANTGGGGGGAQGGSYLSGSGGSGIVIVSYPDVYAAATTVNATASTSGSGSMYMNGISGAGGGPYLSYPNSSTMQFGSGNFTIEAWCYFTVVQESTIAARYPFDSTNNEWNFGTGSSLIPNFSYTTGGNTSAGSVGGVSALSINTWYHIAVVRNSTVLTMYINGTSVATSTIAGSIYSGTTTSTVGAYAQSAYPNGYAVPNGYLSNVRVVKGTAVYTSNFTPSTTPLTAISGTSLLLNTVSGSYTTDSSSNSFTPSAPSSYGKPAWNQLSPFTGTGYKNRVYTWTTSGSITF